MEQLLKIKKEDNSDNLSSKLDWTVSKIRLKTEEKNILTPYYATIRNDTNAVLGCVSDVYKVFDNNKLIELAQRVCDERDFKIGGYLEIDGGKKVIVQIFNGKIDFRGDTFFNYLSIFNSFTGKNKLGVTLSNRLSSCQNQFYHAPDQGKFCFQHSGDMEANVQKMLDSIKGVEKEQDKFYDDMEAFYNHPINDVNKVEMTLKLLGYKLSDLEDENNDLSTKMINKYNLIIDCINSEMLDKGESLYGWFNGITYYCTYYTKSVYRGIGLKLSNDAYIQCLRKVKALPE